MEKYIVVVTDHIENHPPADGGKYTVVSDGAAYGVYATIARRSLRRTDWERPLRTGSENACQSLRPPVSAN